MLGKISQSLPNVQPSPATKHNDCEILPSMTKPYELGLTESCFFLGGGVSTQTHPSHQTKKAAIKQKKQPSNFDS